MRVALSVCLALLSAALFSACGGDPTLPDGGARSDAAPDAAPFEVCARDTDCDETDALYCTVHRCMPGAAGADARGCVLSGGPCAVGEECDEARGACGPATCSGDPDADGDGERSYACGGNDCDDDDMARWPGGDEVCDADGHDEDCRSETVASPSDGDIDGDGFTSALCCNGPECGDDCDDTDRAVFPGARELCNGIDDDCDGATDEDSTELPLCPGGSCSAGRCDLPAWNRTLGGAGYDVTFGLAMDERGNVYLLGTFEDSVNFGAPTGPVLARGSQDIYLVSYAADGAFRWLRQYGAAGRTVFSFDVGFDTPTGQLYFVASSDRPLDFGGGASPGGEAYRAIVALNRDGEYLWEHALPAMNFSAIRAANGPTIVGSFSAPFDLGGGPRVPTGRSSAYVLRLAPDGTHQWDRLLLASDGGTVSPYSVDGTPVGDDLLVAGSFEVGADFGSGSDARAVGGRDLFVARLEETGDPVWQHVVGGLGHEEAVGLAVAEDGTVYVGGSFEGSVDFGDPGPALMTTRRAGYIATLDSEGTPRGSRRLGTGAGDSDVLDLAVTAGSGVLAVGPAAGQTDFGGGLRDLPPDPGSAAFVVEYDDTLFHRSDLAYYYSEFPSPCTDARCAARAVRTVVGPGGSTVVAGVFSGNLDIGGTIRRSNGQQDVFIVRLHR